MTAFVSPRTMRFERYEYLRYASGYQHPYRVDNYLIFICSQIIFLYVKIQYILILFYLYQCYHSCIFILFLMLWLWRAKLNELPTKSHGHEHSNNLIYFYLHMVLEIKRTKVIRQYTYYGHLIKNKLFASVFLGFCSLSWGN